MTSVSNSSIAFSLPSGEVPLGMQNPLLPPTPLGQPMLQPKFLTPLGTRSLTVLDASIFSSEALTQSDPQLPFQDSPFFDLAEPSRASEVSPQAIQPKMGSRSSELIRDSTKLSPGLSIPEFVSESIPDLTPAPIPEFIPASLLEVPTGVKPSIAEAAVVPADGGRSESSEFAIAYPAPAVLPEPLPTGPTSVVQPAPETAIAPTSAEAKSSASPASESSESLVDSLIATVLGTELTATDPVVQPYLENTTISLSVATEPVSELDSASRSGSTTEPFTEAVTLKRKVPAQSTSIEPTTITPTREALAQSSEPESVIPQREVSIQSTTQSIESTPDLSLTPLEVLSESSASSPMLEESDPDPFVDSNLNSISEEPVQPLLAEERQPPEIEAVEAPPIAPPAATNGEDEKPMEAIADQPMGNQERPSETFQVSTNDPTSNLPSVSQESDQLDQDYVSQIEVLPEIQTSEIQTPEVKRSEVIQQNLEPGTGLEDQTEKTSEIELNNLDNGIATNQLTVKSDDLINRMEASLEYEQSQSEKSYQSIAIDTPAQLNQANLPARFDQVEKTTQPIIQSETQLEPESQPTITDTSIQFDPVENIAHSAIQSKLENQPATTDAPVQFDPAEESTQPIQPEIQLENWNQPNISDNPIPFDSFEDITHPTTQPESENRSIATDPPIQLKQIGDATHSIIQPESESKPDVTDASIQLEQIEESIQQLPTVIQRLSVWEPLVQLRPISSAIASPFDPSEHPNSINEPNIQQRDRSFDQLITHKTGSAEAVSSVITSPLPKKLADIEPVTEWSSIAGLLQASIESRSERRQPEVTSGIAPEITQIDAYADLNLYSESNSTPLDILQREIEAPAAPEIPATPTTSVESNYHDQSPLSQQLQPQASPEQLERLAQEVYRLVRQRLALERERVGNLYSGRLL